MWSNLFTGGALSSIEGIAKEWIETGKEKAEAKSLFIKTLDPNGLMRRDISRKVSSAYLVYLFLTMGLILLKAFHFGNITDIGNAITDLTNLFVPITTMFTAIVGTSFGVNYTNVLKGK